jgi:type IV secretory pathway TraG/TraD family ATPase VirD4
MSDTAVLTTSTKGDVITEVASARRDVPQLLYDPSGTLPDYPGVTKIGFSLLDAAQTWDGALQIARSLADTKRQLRGGRAEDHWDERASALIATMTHASALRGDSLHHFALAVEGRRADEHFDILRHHYGDSHHSVAMMHGILATDARELSGIWSSTSGLIAGLRTDAARRLESLPRIDMERALGERSHIHIVSPSRHQALSAPLVVGLIESAVQRTYDDSEQSHRLLLALDELANVAPLPGLAGIVSEGGGQGVTTLACLQDLSQARLRWPISGDAFLSLFPTTVVLPGIADRYTLQLISELSGRRRDDVASWNTTPRGRTQSINWSRPPEPVMTVAQVANGRVGFGLGINETNELRWIELTPAYRDPRFRDHRERDHSSRSRTR